MKAQTGLLAAALLAAACGGGGGGTGGTADPAESFDGALVGVASSNPDMPRPSRLAEPARGDAAAYDTAEYRRSGGLGLIGAAEGYALAGARGGAGTSIAILDTGLDLDQPEFDDAALYVFQNARLRDVIGDPDGHGTHVAGVAAARRDGRGVHGVAYRARPVAIKVLRSVDGMGGARNPTLTFTTDAALGVYSAAGLDRTLTRLDGAGNPLRDGSGATVSDRSDPSAAADVVNMSFVAGADPRGQLLAAMRAAAREGVILVAALGNERRAGASGAPAVYVDDARIDGHAIAVAALDRTGRAIGAADRSNSNLCGAVHNCLAAPGDAITSTIPTSSGRQALATYSGTSMAAPHVAGAAAVARAAFPGVAPRDIVARILATAEDLGEPGRDAVFGWGRLDMAALLAPVGTLAAPLGDRVAGPAASLEGLAAAPGPGLSLAGLDGVVMVIDRQGFPFLARLSGGSAARRGVDLRGFLAAPGATRAAATPDGRAAAEAGFRADRPRWRRAGPAFRDDEAGYGRATVALSDRFAFTAETGVEGPGPGVTRHALRVAASPLGRGGAAQAGAAPYVGTGERVGLAAALGEDARFAAALQTGEGATGARADAFTAGVVRDLGPATVAGRIGYVAERGAVGGARLGGFQSGADGETLFAGFGLDLPLGDRISLGADYDSAWTAASGGAGDLARLSARRAEAASVSLSLADALTPGDSLRVIGALPLAAVSGSVSLSAPVARTEDGRVIRETRRASVAPEAREKSLQIVYDRPLGPDAALGLAGFARIDADGRSGETDLGVAGRLRIGF